MERTIEIGYGLFRDSASRDERKVQPAGRKNGGARNLQVMSAPVHVAFCRKHLNRPGELGKGAKGKNQS